MNSIQFTGLEVRVSSFNQQRQTRNCTHRCGPLSRKATTTFPSHHSAGSSVFEFSRGTCPNPEKRYFKSRLLGRRSSKVRWNSPDASTRQESISILKGTRVLGTKMPPLFLKPNGNRISWVTHIYSVFFRTTKVRWRWKEQPSLKLWTTNRGIEIFATFKASESLMSDNYVWCLTKTSVARPIAQL